MLPYRANRRRRPVDLPVDTEDGADYEVQLGGERGRNVGKAWAARQSVNQWLTPIS